MPQEKFYMPHPYQSRGTDVLIDPKAPNVARVCFDVDGGARYLFALSRRDLARLAGKIERALREMPPPSRRKKSVP
jgi:hypothetical protein